MLVFGLYDGHSPPSCVSSGLWNKYGGGGGGSTIVFICLASPVVEIESFYLYLYYCPTEGISHLISGRILATAMMAFPEQMRVQESFLFVNGLASYN